MIDAGEKSRGKLGKAKVVPSNSDGHADDFPDMRGKICRRCGQWKKAMFFNRSAKAKDGLHSYCRECARAARLARKVGNPVPASTLTEWEHALAQRSKRRIAK